LEYHLLSIAGARVGYTPPMLDQRVSQPRYADDHGLGALTEREIEIMQLTADGLNSRAIAGRLSISQRTERNHVAHILAKLRVHSRLQAVLLCLRHGVVELR
jgi:DNA-binding NarL/FixJ family response regulator